MPRKPQPRWDKGSSQYRVDINYKRHYLGRDLAEANKKFHMLMLVPKVNRSDLRIGELILQYKKDREEYFANNLSGWDRGRLALRLCDHMFRMMRVDDFGPLELRQMREWLLHGKDPKTDIKYDLCRNSINRRIGEVIAMLRWGVSLGIVGNDVWQRCKALAPLRAGKTTAKEPAPIGSASDEALKAVLDAVPESIANMLRLQNLTAARPGEIRELTPEDIDRSGAVWRCELAHHKTAHHDAKRIIFFGPEAQQILTPLLLKTKPGEPLFPNEDGRAYTKDSYPQAVRRACKKVGAEKFTPNMLRHKRLTEIEDNYDREAVQGVAGHKNLRTGDFYTKRGLKRAETIAAEKG